MLSDEEKKLMVGIGSLDLMKSFFSKTTNRDRWIFGAACRRAGISAEANPGIGDAPAAEAWLLGWLLADADINGQIKPGVPESVREEAIRDIESIQNNRSHQDHLSTDKDYAAGAIAYAAGLKLHDNPNTQVSLEWRQWSAGYLAAAEIKAKELGVFASPAYQDKDHGFGAQ